MRLRSASVSFSLNPRTKNREPHRATQNHPPPLIGRSIKLHRRELRRIDSHKIFGDILNVELKVPTVRINAAYTDVLLVIAQRLNLWYVGWLLLRYPCGISFRRSLTKER